MNEQHTYNMDMVKRGQVTLKESVKNANPALIKGPLPEYL